MRMTKLDKNADTVSRLKRLGWRDWEMYPAAGITVLARPAVGRTEFCHVKNGKLKSGEPKI